MKILPQNDNPVGDGIGAWTSGEGLKSHYQMVSKLDVLFAP